MTGERCVFGKACLHYSLGTKRPVKLETTKLLRIQIQVSSTLTCSSAGPLERHRGCDVLPLPGLLQSDSPFKLTFHIELLTDSKPFSRFKTVLSAKNGLFFQ